MGIQTDESALHGFTHTMLHSVLHQGLNYQTWHQNILVLLGKLRRCKRQAFTETYLFYVKVQLRDLKLLTKRRKLILGAL